MSKFEEEIAILENALKGALLVPSECTFVSSEVIKTCLDTLKTYESWEYLIEHEIEEKIRLGEREKVLDECYAEIKDLIDVVCKGDTRPHFAWDVVYRELWVGLDKRFKKIKEQE